MTQPTTFKTALGRAWQVCLVKAGRLLKQWATPAGPHYILELTGQCNQSCRYCYNVWKLAPGICGAELDTRTWCDLIAKLQDETGCLRITLSGGEPLVREDFRQILAFCHRRGLRSILITNGQLLDAATLDFCLAHGVRMFELTLLGADAATHDALTRTPGSWERALAAMSRLYRAGATWCGVFVATRENIAQVRATVELLIALGARVVMFNRFNPGGAGAQVLDLMPSAPQVETALGELDGLAAQYGVRPVAAIPIMPCLVDIQAFPRVEFAFCPVGQVNAYPTIGPGGQVRPCNHSATILGDFRVQWMREILDSPTWHAFRAEIPEICRPCPGLETCRAGCRAAAEVCFGSPAVPEPWLEANLDRLSGRSRTGADPVGPAGPGGGFPVRVAAGGEISARDVRGVGSSRALSAD
jgi:radical SAM protein with 4Fe4S-binding SPASM domain